LYTYIGYAKMASFLKAAQFVHNVHSLMLVFFPSELTSVLTPLHGQNRYCYPIPERRTRLFWQEKYDLLGV